MNDSLVIAQELQQAASAIHDRLMADWNRLTQSQRDALDRDFRDIMAAVMRLRTAGVEKLLEGTKVAVAQLTSVTAAAREKIKTIGDVQKAIKVATAVFALAASVAASVAAPNPAAIVAAAESLKTVIDTASA